MAAAMGSLALPGLARQVGAAWELPWERSSLVNPRCSARCTATLGTRGDACTWCGTSWASWCRECRTRTSWRRSRQGTRSSGAGSWSPPGSWGRWRCPACGRPGCEGDRGQELVLQRLLTPGSGGKGRLDKGAYGHLLGWESPLSSSLWKAVNWLRRISLEDRTWLPRWWRGGVLAWLW